MGAGASVDEDAAIHGARKAEEALDTASDVARSQAGDALGEVAGSETAEAVGAAAVAAGGAASEAVAPGVDAASDAVTAAVEAIPEEQRAAAAEMFEKCRETMTSEQLQAAAKEVSGTLSSLNGAGILAGVGSALSTAADGAPEVAAACGTVLVAIGEHLPYISVAAGLLGAMVVAFRMSKENDQNVQTVLLWSTSVKDWLLLIAGRVESSGAKSTLPLFEGLQDALGKMSADIQKQQNRWRITKMITSATFAKEFEIAKTRVLELKNALRDFLDQESQDAQEAKLQEIGDSTLQIAEKMDSMDSQLAEIKALLQAQNQSQNRPKGDTDTSDEEALYQAIQNAAGVTGEVPFKHFVIAFESFLLKGATVPAEVKRGLRIAIDHEGTGVVHKVQWIKFYRQWEESGMTIDDFLLKLADEAPPTLYAVADEKAHKAYAYATEKYHNVDKEALKEQATEKAAEMAEKGKALAGSALSMGKSLFGTKS